MKGRMDDDAFRVIDVPNKRAALPFLRFRVTAEQLKEIAADVTPGRKAPFQKSDIQNWTKRGFLSKETPGAKQYSPSEASSILLFADLKNIVGLDGAAGLLRFINGDPDTEVDDLISPRKLYEYYAEVYDATADQWEHGVRERLERAREMLESEELPPEDKERLAVGLVIMTFIAQANFYREMALEWMESASNER